MTKNRKKFYADDAPLTAKELRTARPAGQAFPQIVAAYEKSELRYRNLKQLGKKTVQPASPDEAVLERVPRPHPEHDYLVRFTCPEFTSLCPLTGQPDFAHIVIDYVPGKWLVESKSLKLFLTSFRNHGDFHEACTVGIGVRLIQTIAPKWIRISGYWYPRGGMPIDVFFQKGKLPQSVFVPDTGVAPYRGRG